MGRFEKIFKEPFLFSHGALLLDGNKSQKEACEIFDWYTGDQVSSADLTVDYVRFGYAPDYIDDIEAGRNCWFTTTNKKGAKPVWVYEE